MRIRPSFAGMTLVMLMGAARALQTAVVPRGHGLRL